eukprot:gene4180-6526_t
MSDPRRCVAVADYVAQNEDELTFQSGDIIFVPRRTNEDKWQGVLNGKIGWFPKIYVDDKTVEVKSGDTTKVCAIRAYEAANAEELSFPKGALMIVTTRENENYWRGEYEGKTGLILAIHVEAVSSETKPKVFEGAKCRAVRSHVPSSSSDLPFKVGDTIFVPKPDPNANTWKGKLALVLLSPSRWKDVLLSPGVCNSEIGTFPKKFVVNTADHSEEEIKKLIDENSKLTDEEDASKQLEERNAVKQHALQRRTSLTAAAADVATYFSKPPQSPLPKATEVTPKETNDQYEEINTEKSQDENTNPIEEDSKNSDKSPDKSETPKHVDSTNQKDTADATDNDRKQASTAVKNQDISDINTNALSPKERKILEKKQAKEAKQREKEEKKRQKEEAKLAKKREKEEAKQRKLAAKVKA